MIGHPREEMLLAFQDHGLDDRRRQRMAGHLSGCQRCRNVVQAHRTVRGVFALEAPFAPDGVLERAFASRATGTIVLLPVAEPDPIRQIPLPSRGFLIAAGLLLMLGIGVQVVPMGRFNQVFGALGAVIEEWETPDPFHRRPLLRYPDPPVADGALLDPARMRPLRATYRITRHQGPDERRRSLMNVEVSRAPGGWLVQTIWRTDPARLVMQTTTVRLSDSLTLLGWEVTLRTGVEKQFNHRYQFTLWPDSVGHSYRFLPDSGQVQPPSRLPYDSTHVRSKREHAPLAVGDGHLYTLIGAARLRRGWVGSFVDLRSGTYLSAFDYQPTTLLAAGSDSVTTPAGSFAAWQLRGLELQAGWAERIWVNKATGLVVKSSSGDRWWKTEVVLESVTYP